MSKTSVNISVDMKLWRKFKLISMVKSGSATKDIESYIQKQVDKYKGVTIEDLDNDIEEPQKPNTKKTTKSKDINTLVNNGTIKKAKDIPEPRQPTVSEIMSNMRNKD